MDEARPAGRRRGPKRSAAQTMGGILFGFEQQVLRTTPPPHELVHHARPDAPVPAGDGTMLSIELRAPEATEPAELDPPSEPRARG